MHGVETSLTCRRRWKPSRTSIIVATKNVSALKRFLYHGEEELARTTIKDLTIFK